MIKFIPVLSIVSFLHVVAWAQAAGFGGQRVIEESWTFRDGAPERVETLAQTGDGFLWLGGETGLFRFDGIRFERFHSSSGDQLLSTNVYSILAPSTGGLWVGYTFGGFSFVNHGWVKNYGKEIAATTGTIEYLSQGSDGAVWAATGNGLWRFQDSAWQHLGAEWNAPNGRVERVGSDRSGILWVMAGKRLLYLRPGSKQFRVADEDLRAAGFTLDADGKVVTGPRAQQAPSSTAESEQGPKDLPILRDHSSQITDRNHSVWIMDAPSLARIPSIERLKNVPPKISTDNYEAYDVHPYVGASGLVDREGNVWFGDAKGIYRFLYSPLMEQEIPLKSGPYAVAADDDGALWIGSWRSSELNHIAKGKIDAHYAVHGIGGRDASWSCVYRAPDRSFWFGGGGGLWHLVDRKLVSVNLPPEMMDQASFMQAITADRAGGLWISFGRHGLYRLADGLWTPYGGRVDLPKTGVVTEYTDSLGRVWFGFTKSQLAVLDGDQVRVFGPGDGVRVGNITAIYGRGPEIWIGGEFGLQRFDNGRFHNIVAVNSDWLLGIAGIVETANGDLWLNGLTGIFHIGRDEIAEAVKDSAYQVKGEHFGTREGLPGVAEQVRPLGSVIEGSDGRLWFAETSGLVWLDPSGPARKVLPPPITIQSVVADDKNYEAVSSLAFPAHTSSVQINYAAISLSDPEAIRFRYKLQETDADWHEVGTPSPVMYRNLLPGAYHFRVAASDTNGSWSDKVADVDFTILPAWYQTNWFRVSSAAAVLLLVSALYQLRLRRVAGKFNMALEARVIERTRIARDLHDTLLQSFHGLLFRIQAARNMLAGRPEEAMEALDGVIARAEKAITEGRDAIQDLRSELSDEVDLEHLLKVTGHELASFQDANGSSPVFRVTVEGARQHLSPILQDEVYRIAREVLRNAFVHAGAFHIEAEIRYDDRQFRLRIRDDGKGITPTVLNRGSRAGHWGLPGIRERAKQIGAHLEFWSEAGAGTEVELIVPASVAYKASQDGQGFRLFRKARKS